MKKIPMYILGSLFVALFMTACGQSISYVNINTEAECQTINKKLLKVDKFTKMVNETRSFHLEEAAAALTTPGITRSNNKRQMLRDAEKRKAELEAEHKKFGCDVITK